MFRVSKLQITVILLVAWVSQEKPYQVNYDQSSQYEQIFKLFYDVKDGYFVDIGAFDPLTFSNTLSLYTKGWNGLNVQASPERFRKFHPLRSEDVSMNIAVGKSLDYLNLYQPKAKAMATINEQMAKGSEYIPMRIPAITMKQLCARYYAKKPNLMSLDIENYEAIALAQNDWSNPKCRPEVLVTEKDNQKNALKTQRQILEENGYKFFYEFIQNQFYIQSQFFEKYQQKYKEGEKAFKQKNFIKVNYILNAFYKYTLNQSRNYWDQTNNTNEPFYYYFPKQNKNYYLQNINLESNLNVEKKNRPILILNYNPENTVLLLRKGSETIERFSPEGYPFTNITITKNDGVKFSTYIFSSNVTVEYVFNTSCPPASKPQKPISAQQSVAVPAPPIVEEPATVQEPKSSDNFTLLLILSLIITMTILIGGAFVLLFTKLQEMKSSLQALRQFQKVRQTTISSD